jgi:hypothetical protein
LSSYFFFFKWIFRKCWKKNCVWQGLFYTQYINNCIFVCIKNNRFMGPPWTWSYGNLICNYLCNQCLSPLMLWVRTLFRRGVLNTTLCDKVCKWLVAGQWFSPITPVPSTNKTDHHYVTEILLKVTLNTITPPWNLKIDVTKYFRFLKKMYFSSCIIK